MRFLEFMLEGLEGYNLLLFDAYKLRGPTFWYDVSDREERRRKSLGLLIGVLLLIISFFAFWVLQLIGDPHGEGREFQGEATAIVLGLSAIPGALLVFFNASCLLNPWRVGMGEEKEFYKNVRELKSFLKLDSPTYGLTHDSLRQMAEAALIGQAMLVVSAQRKNNEREAHRLIERCFREPFDVCQNFGLADKDGWKRIMRLAEEELDKKALHRRLEV